MRGPLNIKQPWRSLPAIIWAALIFLLSSRSVLPDVLGVPGVDKVVHGSFYGAFSLLIVLALGSLRARTIAVAVLLTSVYGITDEIHQSFVPGRTCDIYDWLADTVGAALFCAVLWRFRGVKQDEV